MDRVRRCFKGGYLSGFSLIGQRIATVSGLLAIEKGLLSGFLE